MKPLPAIYPCRTLTVIFRDDGPLIHCGDSPAYRSVQIEFTDEQIDKLKCAYTHSSGEHNGYESVSKCFIEPPKGTP